VWSIDYKGWLVVGDGTRCDPLTVNDVYSRASLECRAMVSPKLEDVRRTLESCFWRLGLPRYMLSDNGPPFASGGLGRLSRLGVWLLRLGVQPVLIEPGRPDQNGRHERFHETLKQETTTPPRSSIRTQQSAIGFDPLDFLSRLAALVPRPRAHILTYHGILAPAAEWRDLVVPRPRVKSSPSLGPTSSSPRPEPDPASGTLGPALTAQAQRPTRTSWAELMKRVFALDVLVCPHCGGPRRLIAPLTDGLIVRKILTHLGLSTAPGEARPASSVFFRFDIDFSCPEGLWETAASVLEGYIKAEGISLHRTTLPPEPRRGYCPVIRRFGVATQHLASGAGHM